MTYTNIFLSFFLSFFLLELVLPTLTMELNEDKTVSSLAPESEALSTEHAYNKGFAGNGAIKLAG